MPNFINRSNAEALIPEQVSAQIIQNLPTQSVFLAIANKLPNMTSKQLRIPVLSGLASAKFLTGDYAKKPTTNLTWDKVYITAEEIAVIVPVPDAVLDDASYDIWGEVYPRITEAFGKAIDQAAFFGIGKPDSWPDGLVPGAIAAGNIVELAKGANGPAVYQAISGEDGVLAKVEELGLAVNGFAGALQLRSKLRGAVDNNGQPIFRSAYSNGVNGRFAYELEGQQINFPANGCWDAHEALMLAGDFSYARYAIRQDMTFKIFDQSVITDEENKVALSAMENDCHFLRAVMRLGWALPRPVNAISGNEYYPFAALVESGKPLSGASFVPDDENETRYGKKVSALQTGVTISGGVISGKLNKITDYSGFSSAGEKQSGNFLALKLNRPEGAKVTAELVGGVGGPKVMDDDFLVLRITNKDSQTVKLTAERDGRTVIKTYALTGLTLAS